MANSPGHIKYPNQIDTSNIDILTDNVSSIRAGDFNTLRKAVLNIEGELGIKPRGIYSTVRARLDALQAIIGFGDDFIVSRMIDEADGTSGQDTNTGSGIKTGHIQDSAITTAKLADLSVTTAKLANTSVTTAKLADLSVTTAKLANLSVTTAKLANNSVTTAKIPNNTVVRSIQAGVSTYQDAVWVRPGPGVTIQEDADGITIRNNFGPDGYIDLQESYNWGDGVICLDVDKPFKVLNCLGGSRDGYGLTVDGYGAVTIIDGTTPTLNFNDVSNVSAAKLTYSDGAFSFVDNFNDYDVSVIAETFANTGTFLLGRGHDLDDYPQNWVAFDQGNIDIVGLYTLDAAGNFDGYADLAVRDLYVDSSSVIFDNTGRVSFISDTFFFNDDPNDITSLANMFIDRANICEQIRLGDGGIFGGHRISIIQGNEDVVSLMTQALDGYVDFTARNITATGTMTMPTVTVSGIEPTVYFTDTDDAATAILNYDGSDNIFLFADAGGSPGAAVAAENFVVDHALALGVNDAFNSYPGTLSAFIQGNQDIIGAFSLNGSLTPDGYVDLAARDIYLNNNAPTVYFNDLDDGSTGMLHYDDELFIMADGSSNLSPTFVTGLIGGDIGLFVGMGNNIFSDLDQAMGLIEEIQDHLVVRTFDASFDIDGYGILASKNLHQEIGNASGISGTYTIDLDGPAVQNIYITGATYFTAEHLSNDMSKSVSLRINSGAVPRAVTFDGDWAWVGTYPTTIDGYAHVDGYCGMLSLMSFGGTGADIVAAYEDLGTGVATS